MFRQTNSSQPIISINDVADEKANRCYYITHSFTSVFNKISKSINAIYQAIHSNLGLDQFSFQTIKTLAKPTLYTGVFYIAGNELIKMNSYDDNKQDYTFQFLIASSFLLYSTTNSITQYKIQSVKSSSLAMAGDLLSISYLYSSSRHVSHHFLNLYLPEKQAQVIGLGVSVIAIPAIFSALSFSYQKHKIKKLNQRGAQLSDTMTVSGGLTPISNIYFQLYYFLTPELFILSRLFQLALISENILNADNIIQQYRNVPALFIDIWPGIIKRLKLESKRAEKDYKFNTHEEKVWFFDSVKTSGFFKNIQRKDLRTNHLVSIRDDFDFNSSSLSGEVEILEDEKISNNKGAKIHINYKAKNGEDNWQLFKLPIPNNLTHVSLNNIKKYHQPAVLKGVKLNLNGEKNAFIRIKPEDELISSNAHEKKSVINQIINQYKSNNVKISILSAIIMASLIERQSIYNIPFYATTLLLNLFQMMIPFSESFLREMININLMKELNQTLNDNPMETIDALCVTDFCNTLAGYYSDIFPAGAAIISDKTGTLTTSKMETLGFWTNAMPTHAESYLDKKNEDKSIPDIAHQMICFEVFASAFQDSKPELELEEFAILDYFKKIFTNNCLSIHIITTNHLSKIISLENKCYSIETRHLGLYRSLGGRFTLVSDDQENYYLVFCGIPKNTAFINTPLLNIYSTMKMRTGVLSRDWCIARARISADLFEKIKTCFNEENDQALEKILSDGSILSSLQHHGT
ncbi:MAG: cation-transporting P-type ATPase, partial [Gammaproteobacteria bacterium]|nr:cation-transporting P-type ATPase [Gammaproteobacteria bacterium]